MPFPDVIAPGRQFVNSADSIFTTGISSPVDFTRSAKQRSVRKTPVGLSVKRIQCPEIPFPNSSRCELENNSASVQTACRSSTVEPDMLPKHSYGSTRCSISPARASMNHLKIPTPGLRMDFVDRAYAVCAAGRCHTVDVSAWIYRDSRTRA